MRRRRSCPPVVGAKRRCGRVAVATAAARIIVLKASNALVYSKLTAQSKKLSAKNVAWKHLHYVEKESTCHF